MRPRPDRMGRRHRRIRIRLPRGEPALRGPERDVFGRIASGDLSGGHVSGRPQRLPEEETLCESGKRVDVAGEVVAKSSQSEVRAVVPAAPATGRGNGWLYMRVRPVLPEMLQTILDIGWMGGDIALNTRYHAASDLIDLVAGGRREFCDQPDLFYSAAFIDVARGREYEIHIPRSEAVCIHAVMASRRDGVVTQTSWATRSAEEARRPHVLRICDAPGDPDVLDASPHEGLCTTYVRLYFLDRVDDSNCGHDMRLELKTLGQRTQRVVPASLAALGRFLPIRELIVIVKFLSFTLNSKRVSNVFTINDPDRFKGWMARIKEFFVHDRGRY